VDKQTTFRVSVTQRRRRLANVRITVSKQFTTVDGLAFGNENAPPLALGLLLYAARAFTTTDEVRAGIDLALQAWDPEVDLDVILPGKSQTEIPGIDEDDIPF